ncbi:MAG TPA: hypothetical protein DIW47_09285 [Bacteroidetes bacterium]|nr:hypothetical protein [Bacteroidota bacterium]
MVTRQLTTKPAFLLFCLLLISAISRVPLLFPDRMVLDGDEALMGLMSIHQLELGETPWFFWGQRYGFSLIEVSFISFFHQILGYSDLAVKTGMLSLWLVALSGLFLFLKEKLSARWAFALVLLFALHPVWFYWSIKARGGYLTALACSGWLFFLAAKPSIPLWIRGLGIGIFMALIYHAMKLWFPSSILFVAALLYQQNKKLPLVFFALTSFVASFSLMYFLSLDYPDYWNPRVIDISLWQSNLGLALSRVQDFFEGNYFLGDIHPVKNWTLISWQLIKGLFMCSMILAVLQWKERTDKVAQFLFLGAALAPLGVLIITNEFFSPRYLLPAPFFLFFWCALQWNRLRYTGLLRTIGIAASFIFLAGSWQLTQTDYFQKRVQERIDKIALSKKLLDDGYTHVLCNTPETHWQLMYYSKGQLVCSGIYPHDRFQAFPNAVREAYNSGKPVPVLSGDPRAWQGLDKFMEPYGSQYLIRKPTPGQLDSMDFEMRILY